MKTEKALYSELEMLKKNTIQAYHNGKYKECFEYLDLTCSLARHFYLLWTIPEFEDILLAFSKSMSVQNRFKNEHGDEERIVFYDTHATDNYVLTQQYLAAALSWNVNILYITNKDMNMPNRKNIKEMLDCSPRAKIEKIPGGLDVLEAAEYIVKMVCDFGTTKCLVHTQSFDLMGIIAFGALDLIEKFYIETSDHIFWLGTKAFDYYIVFRSLGYNTCVQHRGIPSNKLLLQPYYPIMYSRKLQPYPVNHRDSVKILSGARIEKVYGDNDKYFELIEGIIRNNSNVEFYYIGAGVYGKLAQTSYLEKQIAKRQYGDNFHVLGFRNDITELMKEMDIYMGTYPIGGGLMTQIAASQGLPIVQYVAPGLSSSVGEFIDCENRKQPFVFENPNEFYAECNHLIRDKEYRRRIGKKLKHRVLTEQEFNEQAKVLIFNKKSPYKPDQYETDCKANRINQIDIENKCSHDYARILVKKPILLKKHPLLYLKSAIEFITYTDKKWIVKKIIGR